MNYMFWIWLGVLVFSAIIELVTREIVSIWFTFGAVVPFVLSATGAVGWIWQVVIFIVLSAVMIVCLRAATKKFLLKNANLHTNTDALIGKRYRMITRTDFETLGSLKVNDVVWSVAEENRQAVEEGEIVEVIKVSGNKLIVKKVSE